MVVAVEQNQITASQYCVCDDFVGRAGTVQDEVRFVGAEYADWHRVMAFSSVFVLPILVVFLLLQNKIVAGLTAGALK